MSKNVELNAVSSVKVVQFDVDEQIAKDVFVAYGYSVITQRANVNQGELFITRKSMGM